MRKILHIFGGIFTIPFLSLAGLIFMVIGIMLPIAVIVEVLSGQITNILRILVSDNIEYRFNIFSWSVPNYLQIPIAIIFGLLLFIVGKWFWKCLRRYTKAF